MYLLVLLAQAVPKPVEIDFPILDVTAPTAGPSLRPVEGARPPARFPSAVKVRTDFKEEIAQSANEVR